MSEPKRAPLNMRTTQALRDRLATEAEKYGRSLAQEVEARMERSFERDDLRTIIREELRAELRAELRLAFAEVSAGVVKWRKEFEAEYDGEGRERSRAQ